MIKRHWQWLCAAVALLVGGQPAGVAADDESSYPQKPLRVITGTPAGSGADMEARKFAAQLADRLGQPVVVENRPGNTGQIALEAVAHAPPDGYTIGVAQGAQLVIYPQLDARPKLDAQRALVPLTILSKHPVILYASAASNIRSLSDLMAMARQRPGVTFASGGVGSVGHLSGEWFKRLVRLDLTHVPYPTRAAANDLVGGHVDTMFYPAIGMLGYLKTERIRALAVSGSARSPLLPDVPTFAEAGVPQFEAYVWAAAVVPRGLPKSVEAKLARAAREAVQSRDYSDYIAELGGTIGGSTPAEAAQFIRDDRARWKAVIDAAAVRLE
jgi:tripartite-type tricarboxylate transporter receptor subunit TctC